MRDDFSQAIKQKLAARAGHLCSNPDCRAPTSGPQLLEERAVNVGVAAHISAAAVGGPRYNAKLTSIKRSSHLNAIWLCQTCAKRIDADELRYTVRDLIGWKAGVEAEAHRRLGKAKRPRSNSSAEREIKRDLKLRDDMHRDFLKNAKEYGSPYPRPNAKPYEKFRHSEFIIHRLGDDPYPEDECRPGEISPWFKLELYDFYHNGIKVILGIESGVVGKEPFYVGVQHWAMIPFGGAFDITRFRETNIWRLGRIPFRNIRHYDLHGDGYYPFPHIYCDFSINGMPYEAFEYAVVGKGEYDWPLDASLRLTAEQVSQPQDETAKD